MSISKNTNTQKKIGVSKKIPARDFPFGTVADVVQRTKELGLDIAEELGNNMVDFRYTKCQYFLTYRCKKFGRGHCH
jgi:hypothetical protein